MRSFHNFNSYISSCHHPREKAAACPAPPAVLRRRQARRDPGCRGGLPNDEAGNFVTKQEILSLWYFVSFVIFVVKFLGHYYY
jgi:hypothetical protein